MRRLLIFLFVIFALVLTACGGDDKGSGDGGDENDNGDNVTSAPNDNQDDNGETQPLGGRTLPPQRVATATFTPVPPTATATMDEGAVANPDNPTTDPNICVSFRPDTVSNQDSESIQIGEDATIYWFRVDAGNMTYLVQLYNSDALSIYVDEVIDLEYTFDASLFTGGVGQAFYWQVIPYQNSAPLEACGALDGEIYVNVGQGLTPVGGTSSE
jgi:predicted small secreted protein